MPGSLPPPASSLGRRDEFQPWQFFVLTALVASTVAVFLSRGTSPENLVFLSAAVLAAAGVGIALYRTLVPLVTPAGVAAPEMLGGRTRAALEREKVLVLRSIKDLEFDRAMGKVSEEDFREMVGRLRARAARLIKQLDQEGSGYRELIEREINARLIQAGMTPRPAAAVASAAGACRGCGTVNDADARFCKGCGTRLETGA